MPNNYNIFLHSVVVIYNSFLPTRSTWNTLDIAGSYKISQKKQICSHCNNKSPYGSLFLLKKIGPATQSTQRDLVTPSILSKGI